MLEIVRGNPVRFPFSARRDSRMIAWRPHLLGSRVSRQRIGSKNQADLCYAAAVLQTGSAAICTKRL
jgi:hypothetical protein